MALLWSPDTWSRAARAEADALRGRHGMASPLAGHEVAGLRAAAGHARRALPGALGELVARELLAYADFGYRGDADALVPQLARQVLTLPALAAPEQSATRSDQWVRAYGGS